MARGASAKVPLGVRIAAHMAILWVVVILLGGTLMVVTSPPGTHAADLEGPRAVFLFLRLVGYCYAWTALREGRRSGGLALLACAAVVLATWLADRDATGTVMGVYNLVMAALVLARWRALRDG